MKKKSSCTQTKLGSAGRDISLSPNTMTHRVAQKQVPHVLLLPYPGQSHVNSMLILGQLLSSADFRVTFLNTEHNQERLQRFSDIEARFSHLTGFQFRTISDGLPADHPRSVDCFMDMFESLRTNTKPLLREILMSYRRESDAAMCIITDGVMTFSIDVADELGIPIIACRTASACNFWAYLCIDNMVEEGELPFEDDGDLDQRIRSVPGMENFLRRRDLPSFLRAKDPTDNALKLVWTEAVNTCRASALILNTFEDLEGPILSHVRSRMPTIYTIGPIHALLKSKFMDSSPSDSTTSSTSNGLWKEDASCMTWLDSQSHKSVIYVSFGSYATVTQEMILEFWYGLVNSKKPFLWVIRPDSVAGKENVGQIPLELEEGTKERGLLVEWVPQQEVLAHPAIGGFVTHSGWNSTMESIYAGIPMICWPFFGDQQINSRYVSEIWKIGLDMKDSPCDRGTVEKMVRELMEGKNDELQKSSKKMAEIARQSIDEGGSSYGSLNRLIEDIRSMSF